MGFIVGLFCGCCLSFQLFAMWFNSRSGRRAERIAAGLDELLRGGRALITISVGIDGEPVVGVIDDWTGFSEHSFPDVTIEGAIAEAIRFRDRKLSS